MIGLNSRNCLYKRNKKTQSVHDHVQLFIRKSFNFVKQKIEKKKIGKIMITLRNNEINLRL